jgi:ASC-1-like (ASCH) protein
MKRTLVFAKTDKHHFDAILRGAKTVETRAGSPMYQKIQAGDTLILKCNGRWGRVGVPTQRSAVFAGR